MWIVTGTVLSSGPASIITGLRRRAGPCRRQRAEELGVAGMAEAGVVERLLVDRIGDDRRRRAGADVADRARDRLDHRRARCAGSARPGAASTARLERHDRQGVGRSGRPPRRARPSAIGHVDAEAGAPARRAAPGRRGSRRAAARSSRRRSQAASVTSGPIPPGSPIVRASGGGSPSHRGLIPPQRYSMMALSRSSLR